MAKRSSGLRFQSTAGIPSKTVPVGKRQRVQIERLSHDGRGIAFLGEATWFVINALPGEEVEARVLSARAKVVDARAERWFSTHPDRQTPACSHADRCGGCTVQHVSAAQQLQLKQQVLAEQLQRAGLEPEFWAAPLSSPAWAYRRRARLAVRWDHQAQQMRLGFRAAASQEIVSIQECPVLVQELQALIKPLQELVSSLERPKALGHLELFSGNEPALLLRLTAPLGDEDQKRWQNFAQAHRAQLWIQTQAEPSLVYATQPLSYALPQWNLQLNCRPCDFVQVNAWVNEAMINQALDWLALDTGAVVLDLFCGLGNFSLPFARQGATVLGIEGVAPMVEQASKNAAHNKLASVCFQQADLNNPDELTRLLAIQHPSAVLLDPPREGAYAVVSQFKRLHVPQILYVSCNPSTLARDAVQLQQAGYCLKRAGVLDMFPQTAHVEAMALFERAD